MSEFDVERRDETIRHLSLRVGVTEETALLPWALLSTVAASLSLAGATPFAGVTPFADATPFVGATPFAGARAFSGASVLLSRFSSLPAIDS